jgi:hypothetical protein
VLNIIGETDMERKLASKGIDDQFNEQVLKEVLKWYHDMVEWLQIDKDPNSEQISSWLNWTFNTVSRKKCLKKARKALAIYMAISTKGYKNIKCSLSFFDKAKGRKIVPPPSITCWGDGSAMFEHLHHKNDKSAKFVQWEFKIEEGWFPYRILSFHLVEVENQFVYPGTMAKWMEPGQWYQLCFDLLGPEGAFQLGSCGHIFRIGCIQQSAVY